MMNCAKVLLDMTVLGFAICIPALLYVETAQLRNFWYRDIVYH